MKFSVTKQTVSKIKADYELVFVVNKNLKHKFIKHQSEFDFYNFTGEGVLNLIADRIIYVGVKSLEPQNIRLAAAKAVDELRNYNVKVIKMASYLGDCEDKSFMAKAEGFVLGSYKFDKYKSDRKELKLQEVIISLSDEFSDKKVSQSVAVSHLEMGKIIAEATNFTKDIVNETPEIYTPIKMASEAQDLAKSLVNVTCKVYDEKYLQKENMNAFLAVNKASIHPARLIHLAYKPKNAKKRVAIVGKGLTYDSGGLSLKPTNFMVTMKSDKAGAAAAMGIIRAASMLGLPIEIHSILGATENMIGGNAYKPDDIITSRSGVTIEVRDTDAEGRLVLSDCLSWAQDKVKPDLLFDIATLTGACVVGLGEYTIGVLGNNYSLQRDFKLTAQTSGELLSVLEFNDHLREMIVSRVADILNSTGSRYGGSITAGLFLDKFILEPYKDKWLHLDIAGPAYLEKAWGYNQYGASGCGVRSILYYLIFGDK